MASGDHPASSSIRRPATVVISLRTAVRCIKYSLLAAIVATCTRTFLREKPGWVTGGPFSAETSGERAEEDGSPGQDQLPYRGASAQSFDLWGSAPANRLLSETSSISASSANSHSSSAGHGHGGCGHADQVQKTLKGTLSFLFFCFTICCLLEHWNLLVPWEWRFPISVIMYIGGIFVGTMILQVFSDDEHKGRGFDELLSGLQGAARIDPHALLYLVLPPLLYESASSMWWHVLRKVLPSAIILAGPGVLLNTLFTGFYVKLVCRIQDKQPTWEASWLLSTILSATDPVAVVAALAALGAPKKLASLLEGESLLNDGTAVVAAYVFRDWVADDSADKSCPGSPPSYGCVVLFFVQVGFGGVCIGLAVGVMLYFWITWARHRHHELLEIAIVLAAVYGSFFIAEAMHMSGVLAVVILGFVMTSAVQTRLSKDGRHAHHIILGQIGYACNQVAFFSAGSITAVFMQVRDKGCDHTAFLLRPWLELAGLYIVIHLTRAVVVIIFSPALRRMGYGISWKEGAILVYGGLRGAVGLIMALIVEHNEHIDPNVSQMIAFHTSGIVLLTLLINGSTVDDVYRKLKIYPKNAFRTEHLQRVLAKFELDCQKAGIRKLVRDWFFKDCMFKSILRCVPNFEYIKFDEAGVPMPDLVASVTKTLGSIEEEANGHRQSATRNRVSMFEREFDEQWCAAKGLAASNFMEILSSSSDVHNRTDWVYRAAKVKSSRLRYNNSGGKNQPGLYVSARPLRVLQGPEDDPDLPSFEITVPRIENAQIIVGFIADDGEVRRPVPTADGQVLGVMPNTIGFNVQTGVVYCNGPLGRTVWSTQCKAPNMSDDVLQSGGVGAHLKVQATIFQDEDSFEWGSYFSSSLEKVGQAPHMCKFGPYDVGDFFPAIEFRLEGPAPPEGDPECPAAPRSSRKIVWAPTLETKMSKAESGSLGKQSAASSIIVTEFMEAASEKSVSPAPLPSVSEAMGVQRENTYKSAWSSDTCDVVDFKSEMESDEGSERSLKSDKKVESPAWNDEDMLHQVSDQSRRLLEGCVNQNIEPVDLSAQSRGASKQSAQSRGASKQSAQSRGASKHTEHSQITEQTEITPIRSPDIVPDGEPPVMREANGREVIAQREVQKPIIKKSRSVGFGGAKIMTEEGSLMTSNSTFPAAGQNADHGGTHESDVEPAGPAAFAEVILSFEPQFVCDSESIVELIHLLFNTVMRQYTTMHECGTLGDQALNWLRASVGEAMDCASKEVNAMRAKKFKAAKRHSEFDKGDKWGAGRRSFTNVMTNASGTSQQEQKRPSIGMGARNSVVSAVRSQMRAVTESTDKQQLVGLFEPLVVEYLALERHMGKQDIWEYCPHRCHRLRQLGYKYTRAKVEALWAFIEAHNHVIKEAPNIDRFPDLVKVIEKIVDECKQDLGRIEEIRPRRFYYAKHDLVLRVLLHRRLSKLKKLMADGWITAGDGQGLVDSLWERIVEADQFTPQLHTPGATILKLERKQSDVMSASSVEVNAWDNIDLVMDKRLSMQRMDVAAMSRSIGIFATNPDMKEARSAPVRLTTPVKRNNSFVPEARKFNSLPGKVSMHSDFNPDEDDE